MYENLEPVGWGGGNLRGLYAEFLDEAAGLLGTSALVAGGGQIPGGGRPLARGGRGRRARRPRTAFAEARRLIGQLQDQVERGDAAQAEAAATAAALWALRDRWRPGSRATTPTSTPC